MMNPNLCIEIDGATASPQCNGPARVADAVLIANCRPYADDTPKVQGFIPYCKANGITRPIVRPDIGLTFLGPAAPANAPADVAPTDDMIVAGYEQGCFDFRRRIPSGPWAGCEQDRFNAICAPFAAANLDPVFLFNAPGELVVDPWAAAPGSRQAAILTRLAASARARQRGAPSTSTPPRDWSAWWPFLRSAIHASCAGLLAESPCAGCSFIVSNSAIASFTRDDGFLQPPMTLLPGQISHAGFYNPAEASTVRCASCRAAHGKLPFAVNLDLEDCAPEQVAVRAMLCAAPFTIVWGNPADLPKLAPLAAALAAWS